MVMGNGGAETTHRGPSQMLQWSCICFSENAYMKYLQRMLTYQKQLKPCLYGAFTLYITL